jgi:hypothetical protein
LDHGALSLDGNKLPLTPIKNIKIDGAESPVNERKMAGKSAATSAFTEG